MRTRGTRGGVLLSLQGEDTPEQIDALFTGREELLAGRVILEVAERVPWRSVERLAQLVETNGGEVTEVRPATAPAAANSTPRGETKVITRTIRSGAKVESAGSLVILGDVNAGAELIANDDIIVIGTLRGLAHAGAGGNENAVIWAQQILSPQLRIGYALAQAGDDGAKVEGGPEVAHLQNGAIVLRPWS